MLMFFLFFGPQRLHTGNADSLPQTCVELYYENLLSIGKAIENDYGYWINKIVIKFRTETDLESWTFIRGKNDKEAFWYHEGGSEISRIWAIKKISRISFISQKIYIQLFADDGLRELTRIKKEGSGWKVVRTKFPKRKSWFGFNWSGLF